jgi:hypothetical protein
MSGLIITETEKKELRYLVDTESLTYNHKVTKKITKLWEQTSLEDRVFLFEFLKVLYPQKVKLINESRWYNTLADIIGIFDPTGVVDILNGISYWRQGDKLFAILSWIGAIPGLGDLIAKPIIGILKVGSPATKSFRAAVEAGNATKIAETASNIGGPVASMVRNSKTWGDNLVGVLNKSIGKVPIGLPLLAGGSSLSGKGFVRLVQEWVDIFKSASGQMKSADEVYKTVLQGSKPLTIAEKELMIKQLEKQSFNPFRSYKGAGQDFSEKYLSGGLGKLWGNRATRSLMVRTKSYLGFLDYLGIGNFDTDPEELRTKVPNVEQKLEEYSKTEKAKKYFKEDFGTTEMSRPPGLTDTDWAEIQGKESVGSKSFGIGDVFTSSQNPIVSLFATLLK